MVFLIGNPRAGYGHAKERIRELVQILRGRGYQLESYFTASAGDAKWCAGRIGPDIDALIIAGGDGLINEVINGLCDPSGIPIVLMPTGTSNVIAKDLGLLGKPEDVARVLEHGGVRRLDMGLVGDHRFLAFVGVGIDAMIAEEVLRLGADNRGYLRYVLPVLRILTRYRPPQLRITVDGTEVRKGGLVLVSNTRNYGGIFVMADQARCDSGHLDVCILPGGRLPALARFYFAASRARVSRTDGIHYLTGRSIIIDSGEPVAVQVDGDYFGTTPVRITLRPSYVPIVIPHRGEGSNGY
jgi:YegS/Rv2252/BmrU family lipid kinase